MNEDFRKMMIEIQSFKEMELEMNNNAISLIDSCNLLLYRYQCLCFLEKKYQSSICILVITTFYIKEEILNQIRILLACIHLSGEKAHYNFKQELLTLGLDFIACI